MAPERLSTKDNTFLPGYAIHAQRYGFAMQYCGGKRVLDAGCGIGYGSNLLARNGAEQVTAVDLSRTALNEAKEMFSHPKVRFLQGDLEKLDEIADLPTEFDVVVNLENIEHLHEPVAFLERASRRLRRPDGVFVVSTPNGAITERDEMGAIDNRFHVKEYTAEEFVALLKPFFSRIELVGQWQTPEAKNRIAAARDVFEQLCEAYFNPAARVGRLVKRVMGKRCAGPPRFAAAGESYGWEYVLSPLERPPYLWEPMYILAACRP